MVRRRDALFALTFPNHIYTTTITGAFYYAPSQFRCPADGFYPDPESCQMFFRCVSNGDGYRMYHFQCGEGTVYDENNQVCNWPSAVHGPCGTEKSSGSSGISSGCDDQETTGVSNSRRPSFRPRPGQRPEPVTGGIKGGSKSGGRKGPPPPPSKGGQRPDSQEQTKGGSDEGSKGGSKGGSEGSKGGSGAGSKGGSGSKGESKGSSGESKGRHPPPPAKSRTTTTTTTSAPVKGGSDTQQQQQQKEEDQQQEQQQQQVCREFI